MDKIVIVDEECKLARRVREAEEQPQWYAMSAPYSRELKAQAALGEMAVQIGRAHV